MHSGAIAKHDNLGGGGYIHIVLFTYHKNNRFKTNKRNLWGTTQIYEYASPPSYGPEG